MAADYYNTLGVDRNASQDDIKKAFRKQAKKHHPDANPDDPQAEQRFKEVNEAYEVLSDPQKRQQYDMFGSGGGQWGTGGPQGTNVNFDDLSDILGSIFGGQGGRPAGASPFGNGSSRTYERRTAPPQKGQSIEQPVTISLREAYDGTQRRISKDGRQITVKIPAGAATGTKVRLEGEGGPGLYGGEAGDLFLVVSVTPDHTFERDGDDLSVDVEVDAFTAMLGGHVEVPTMSRAVRLKIPGGTQSGRKFRLNSKGMPRLRGRDQYGDLYVRILITVPTELNDDQRQQIEALRDSFNAS